MEIDKTLKQFGLDEKEVKIYLSTLQIGKGSVLEIAKKAEVKRPTAYLILESLFEKGLISKVPKKNKTAYVAENPEKLLDIIEKRRKEIKKIIPNLLSIFNVSPDKPLVKMYEGTDGVIQVYDEVLKSKEIWWYGNLSLVHRNFRSIFERYEELIKSRKITVRDFIGNSEFERKYASKGQRVNHEIRISPLPIDLDFSLYGNKMAILSLGSNIYAVTIEDERIVNSFRSLYELAWRQAGKFKK